MSHRHPKALVAALGFLAALVGAPAAAPAQNIVETADASGQFDILVGALEDTGLAPALEGPGPFTVFAPTDAAFEDLPDAEQIVLLSPDNRQQLESLLRFHVVRAELTSEDLVGIAGLVETTMGQRLAFDGTSTPINVGGASVIEADIMADNGVIHVVDRIILPPELNR